MTFGPNFRPRGAQARFTADGKFLFAVGGTAEGHFIPWLPDRSREPVSSGAVTFPFSGPFFSSDGRTLCGVDRERVAVVCQSVTPLAGLAPALGTPTVVFPSGMPQNSAFGNIGNIAKDGRILLLSTDEPEEVALQFLSDWTLLLPSARS